MDPSSVADDSTALPNAPTIQKRVGLNPTLFLLLQNDLRILAPKDQFRSVLYNIWRCVIDRVNDDLLDLGSRRRD